MWCFEHGQAGRSFGVWCARHADCGVDVGGDGVDETGRTDFGRCPCSPPCGVLLHIIFKQGQNGKAVCVLDRETTIIK